MKKSMFLAIMMLISVCGKALATPSGPIGFGFMKVKYQQETDPKKIKDNFSTAIKGVISNDSTTIAEYYQLKETGLTWKQMRAVLYGYLKDKNGRDITITDVDNATFDEVKRDHWKTHYSGYLRNGIASIKLSNPLTSTVQRTENQLTWIMCHIGRASFSANCSNPDMVKNNLPTSGPNRHKEPGLPEEFEVLSDDLVVQTGQGDVNVQGANNVVTVNNYFGDTTKKSALPVQSVCPINYLGVNRIKIHRGDTTLLSWSATRGPIRISNIGNVNELEGSLVIRPLETTTYDMSVYNSDCHRFVTVKPTTWFERNWGYLAGGVAGGAGLLIWHPWKSQHDHQYNTDIQDTSGQSGATGGSGSQRTTVAPRASQLAAGVGRTPGGALGFFLTKVITIR